MAEMNLDGIRLNVLSQPPASINQDGIRTRVLSQVAGANYFRRTPKVELLEALSNATGVSLPVAQYDIGPVVNADPISAKATIDLIALEASGKRRTTPVSYQRRHVDQLAEQIDMDLMKPTTLAPITSYAQMLSSLNNIFGLTLSAYDFLPVTVNPTGDTVLTVAPESHYFIPGGQMNIGKLYGTDREYEMLLRGLNWPAKTLVAQSAFFVPDTFRTEYNKLFNDSYTAGQTTVANQSAAATGESTNRERQIDLSFNVGGTVTNKRMYYNRLNLADVLPQFVTTTCWDLWAGKLFDAANLAELATMIGLPTNEFDLVNTDVVEATPGGPINITLRAATNSKFFRGEATIAITRAPWVTDLVPNGTAFAM